MPVTAAGWRIDEVPVGYAPRIGRSKVTGTLTLIARFEPTKALEVLQRDKVTLMLGVPTMYVALLQHPEKEKYDLSTLRMCASGGASLPVEVLHGFEAAFGAMILRGTACRRPARSPPSTTPAASARPVRSANPSRAWRSA